MKSEEERLNAMEGSLAYNNGYTYFTDKDTFEVIRIDATGQRQILPQIEYRSETKIEVSGGGYKVNSGKWRKKGKIKTGDTLTIRTKTPKA